jgi:hypothetical protein
MVKTAVSQLIDYMKANQYFIGKDLNTEFQRFLIIEKQDLINSYAQGTYDEGGLNTEEDCENFFNENFIQ